MTCSLDFSLFLYLFLRPFGSKRLRRLLKEVLDGLIGNHLLVEDVSTSLGALHHLDNLCVSATIL